MRTTPSLAALALAVAACGDGQVTQPDAGPDPIADNSCPSEPWKALATDLDRAPLCAWGSSDRDVYVVGGGLGVGGALVRHWDGTTWREIDTGQPETLWWVWGSADGAQVWMVGEKGTIVRWDGTRATTLPSGTTAPLYGVWGSGPDDVWIVGGAPGPEDGPDDVVLHWDGQTLAAVDVPRRGASLFKIWGSGPGDVWVTGEAGTILHRTTSGWADRSQEVSTTATLSAVHGCGPDEVYAVGGQAVYRFDGTRWGTVPDAQIFSFTAGVACGDKTVLVVGSGGLKLRLDKRTGRWIDETLDEPYDTDFHGAWVSPGGAHWAVGGNYIAPASAIDRRIGVIAYRGCGTPR